MAKTPNLDQYIPPLTFFFGPRIGDRFRTWYRFLFFAFADTAAMGIATSTLTAKMDDTSDTDDLKTAYRRRKKRRKRHESDTDTSCGASETLPASVAKWTEADLQTILVTYAATGHEEPHSVLDTVTKACKLSELSDSAQKIISYLDETIDFEFKLDENGEIPVLEKELINIKDQLESVYQRVAVSPLKETLTGFDAMAR